MFSKRVLLKLSSRNHLLCVYGFIKLLSLKASLRCCPTAQGSTQKLCFHLSVKAIGTSQHSGQIQNIFIFIQTDDCLEKYVFRKVFFKLFLSGTRFLLFSLFLISTVFL